MLLETLQGVMSLGCDALKIGDPDISDGIGIQGWGISMVRLDSTIRTTL